MRLLGPLLAAAAVVLLAPVSRANGRFPYANQLVFDPKDPAHVALRTTYGFVQTFDSGKTWRWLCEKSVGYGGTFDPAVAITGNGTLLAGVFDGLRASTDRGCAWAFTGAPLDKEFVIDVAVDRASPMRAVAITSSGLGDAGFRVFLAETTDGGKTWAKMGTNLPTDLNSETVELARSDPGRLYASGTIGTASRMGVIERSDDLGKTWTRTTLPLGSGRAPFIAAVHPTNADVVFVRVEGDGTGGDAGGQDRLLVSEDGAKSFREVAALDGKMLGFALSPDGSRVAIGGPLGGLRVASTKDYAFAQTAAISVRCLTWTSDALYACGTEYPDGFTVGKTTDEGKTFQPLHRLSELSPLDCPSTTPTASLCATEWPKVRDTIGVPDDGGADAAAPPDAGPVARGGDAATSSCGCEVVGVTRVCWTAGLFAAASVVLVLRRRR